MIDFYDVIRDNIHYNKVEGIDVADTWTEVNTLSVPVSNGQAYEIKLSLAWNYDTATKSGCIRYSLDGGTTWSDESCEEPKDRTDTRRGSFDMVRDITADGNLDVVIEMYKEDTSHTLTVVESLIMIKRIG